MSKKKTNKDDPKAKGEALKRAIHQTHEKTVARLESALGKLQEGSRQWVEIVNELASEDRRYRRELQEYGDQISLMTTPRYEFIARVQRGSVVWSSPEEEAIRR